MRLDFNNGRPVFGLLDIGTSKFVCLVATEDDQGRPTLIGAGHQHARGLKAGLIVDMDAAEDALRATIVQAETMAGVEIFEAVLAGTCGRMASRHLTTSLDLSGRYVAAADLSNLLAAGRDYAQNNDQAVLHINRIGARIDGVQIGGSPVGLTGQTLAIDINAVTADRAALRQHLHLAERCQLHLRAVIPAPMANALAVTTEDDRRDGVAVVDVGAATTSVALFMGGALVALQCHPVGGMHVTYALARGLDADTEEAERIKKICAILDVAHPSSAETFTVQARRGDHASFRQVTRATISNLIKTRCEALFDRVWQGLSVLPEAIDGCREVVFTGGGSALGGLTELAEQRFGRPVRLGSPDGVPFLPAALRRPAFFAAAGLMPVLRDKSLGLRLDRRQPLFGNEERADDWARPAV